MAKVIRLAQPGYDVKTAGDENLIYSSEWPLLPIYQQGSFTIQDVSQPVTITNHNLGYVPAFWWFSNQDITAWEAGSGTSFPQDTRSEFKGAAGGYIGINETKLQFVPQDPVAFENGSMKIYYYIFTTKLTDQFTAPISNAGQGVVGGQGTRVFKLAKPGKSVKSNNLSDFVIHSDCRSPLVHSVNPGTLQPQAGLLGNSFQANHNLGYIPMFMCYVQNFGGQESGFYELVPSGTSGSTKLQASPSFINYQNGIAGQAISILVLKDPFIVSYSRSVSV